MPALRRAKAPNGIRGFCDQNGSHKAAGRYRDFVLCATVFFRAAADEFFCEERFCETDFLDVCEVRFWATCLFRLCGAFTEPDREERFAATVARPFFLETTAFLCFELERLAETFCLLFLLLE